MVMKKVGPDAVVPDEKVGPKVESAVPTKGVPKVDSLRAGAVTRVDRSSPGGG